MAELNYKKQFSRQDYVTQKYQKNLDILVKMICVEMGVKYGIG